MKPHVFYKINNYYVYLNKEPNVSNTSVSAFSFYDESFFQRYRNKATIQGKLLCQDLQLEDISPNRQYIVFLIKEDFNYVLFVPFVSPGSLSFKQINKDAIIESANEQAKLIIMSFKIAQRQKLLQRLLLTKVDVSESLHAFTEYCFFDKYALWVYNPYSKHFCCVSSSVPMPREYVNEKDASSLYEFMVSSKEHESRVPNRNCVNREYAIRMNALNRLRLDFGEDGSVGILDFLSTHKNFLLREDTRLIIKNHIESKYVEYKQSSLIALHKIEEAFSKYCPGKLKPFLHGLTKMICDELHFQACSIFEHNEKDNTLNIVAVTDLHQKGKPKVKVQYDLSKDTFTGSVLKSEQGFLSSYDISHDPKNSHTYDEATEGEDKTWIAYTLKVNDKKWGVLRVKNKHKRGSHNILINFTPSDFIVLNSVCIHLSNILLIEINHRKNIKQYNELNKSGRQLKTDIDELNTFYKIFLHEIRTPISTFNTSPLRIIKLLNGPVLNEDVKRNIKLKVNDIRVMGERLRFITNTYFFKELVKGGKAERLSVLKDIILPVLNISREYMKKQHDVEIKMDVPSIDGYTVYGDKRLLNLVLNTLISNAGKYSYGSRRPVSVFGEYDKPFEYFFICVSNYGLPIYENEKELIFENGRRGRVALEQKIGGTGIGLYLAHEIMCRQRGEIILSSLRDPVTFKVKIPMSKLRKKK